MTQSELSKLKNILRKFMTSFNVSPAALNFGRFNFAEIKENGESPCSLGAVPIKLKPFSRIPLVSTSKQRPVSRAFSFAAASDATDNAPKWASFTGYIGRRMPLDASLANLVKVSRNLFKQSGILFGLRNRINSSSALGHCSTLQ